MRKIIFLGIIIASIIILVIDCGDKRFNKTMEEAKVAIEKEDYEIAKEKLNLAVFEKDDNKEAKALLDQTSKLIDGKTLEQDGYLQEAKLTYDDINNIDSEYDKIKIESKKLSKNVGEEINKENKSRKFLKELKKCAIDIKYAIDDLYLNESSKNINKELKHIANEINYDNSIKNDIEIFNDNIKDIDNKINN